ncbi:MAG: hypothetical protein ACXWXB_05400 [Actinomycetota bacterium]
MNQTGTGGDRIVDAPELEPLHLEDRVDGPAAAVMMSAGIGIFVLGLLTLLSEASVPIHDFLEFDTGVGPLSGKTVLASAGFLISWLVLGLTMRHKEVDLRRWFWIAFALGVIGAVLMFPPVFQAFASE